MEAESPKSAVDKLITAILEAGIDVSLLQAALAEVRNQSWQAATDHAGAIRFGAATPGVIYRGTPAEPAPRLEKRQRKAHWMTDRMTQDDVPLPRERITGLWKG